MNEFQHPNFLANHRCCVLSCAIPALKMNYSTVSRTWTSSSVPLEALISQPSLEYILIEISHFGVGFQVRGPVATLMQRPLHPESTAYLQSCVSIGLSSSDLAFSHRVFAAVESPTPSALFSDPLETAARKTGPSSARLLEFAPACKCCRATSSDRGRYRGSSTYP